MGFPGGASGKEPTCQGDIRDVGLTPGSGRFPPWRRVWQPTPGFFPGESHGQKSPASYGSIASQRIGQDRSNLARMHIFSIFIFTIALQIAGEHGDDTETIQRWEAYLIIISGHSFEIS